MAGSYQRTAEGILVAHKILGAGSAAEARSLIEHYKVDVLLICSVDLNYWDEIISQDKSFARQLWENQIPSWITVKAHDEEGGFGIYEVSL